MKRIITLLTIAFCLQAGAQEFYFSSKPFKLGETPVSEGNSFTDDQYIYGLAVIDKPLSELDIETQTFLRENGEKYQVGSVTLLYKPGLMMDGSWVSCPIVESNGKSYLYMAILPNPDEAYYLWEHPDGYSDALKPGATLGKKVSFFLQCDAPAECKFLKTVKITKKGNLTRDIIAERKSAIYDANNMQQDEYRGLQAENNDRHTYDAVEPLVKSEHFGPGTFIDIDFLFKKEGQEDMKAYGRFKGFQFELDGVRKTESGRFYIQNYPYGKEDGTVAKLTITNKYNPNCTATVEFPIDYQGSQSINVSGSDGYRGRDGKDSTFGSATSDGRDGGNGENGANVHVYIKEHKPGYLLVKADATGYNPIYRIVSATTGSLLIASNGGDGGYGGGGGHGDSSKGIPNGTAGRGGDGGNGGQIIIHLDNNVATFRSRITAESFGGAGGGYILAGNSGEYGIPGSKGPEPQFKTEKISF